MALKREAHDLAQAYLFLIREGFCARQSIVVDSGAVLVRRRPVAAAGSALASQGAGMARRESARQGASPCIMARCLLDFERGRWASRARS